MGTGMHLIRARARPSPDGASHGPTEGKNPNCTRGLYKQSDYGSGRYVLKIQDSHVHPSRAHMIAIPWTQNYVAYFIRHSLGGHSPE